MVAGVTVDVAVLVTAGIRATRLTVVAVFSTLAVLVDAGSKAGAETLTAAFSTLAIFVASGKSGRRVDRGGDLVRRRNLCHRGQSCRSVDGDGGLILVAMFVTEGRAAGALIVIATAAVVPPMVTGVGNPAGALMVIAV